MPVADAVSSRTDSAADGTRSRPSGPWRIPDGSRPDADAVARIGTGRVCGTAAGMAPRRRPARRPQPPGERHHVVGQLPPAVVGLGAGQDEELALADRGGGERQRRPLERASAGRRRCRGWAGARGSRRSHRRRRWRPGAAIGELRRRRRPRRAGIDPALEGGDEHRRGEAWVLVDPIQRHASRIRGRRPIFRIGAQGWSGPGSPGHNQPGARRDRRDRRTRACTKDSRALRTNGRSSRPTHRPLPASERWPGSAATRPVPR